MGALEKWNSFKRLAQCGAPTLGRCVEPTKDSKDLHFFLKKSFPNFHEWQKEEATIAGKKSSE
jgi:hypothetical protein